MSRKTRIQVVFVVENSVAMSMHYGEIYKTCIEPLARALQQEQHITMNGIETGLILYGDYPPYSLQTVEKRFISGGLDLLFSSLRALNANMSDGGSMRNAVIEGLVGSLEMFADMAPSEELELDVVRHCILVAFTPPHELRCRMSVDERYDNMVLNDVAEVMKEQDIHLSLIAKQRIKELESLVDKVNESGTVPMFESPPNINYIIKLAGLTLAGIAMNERKRLASTESSQKVENSTGAPVGPPGEGSAPKRPRLDEQPIANHSASSQPSANPSASSQLAANQSAPSQPAANQSASSQLVTIQSASPQLAANQSTSSQLLKIASSQPGANQSSSSESEANQSSTSQPAANQSSSSQPIANQSSSPQQGQANGERSPEVADVGAVVNGGQTSDTGSQQLHEIPTTIPGSVSAPQTRQQMLQQYRQHQQALLEQMQSQLAASPAQRPPEHQSPMQRPLQINATSVPHRPGSAVMQQGQDASTLQAQRIQDWLQQQNQQPIQQQQNIQQQHMMQQVPPGPRPTTRFGVAALQQLQQQNREHVARNAAALGPAAGSNGHIPTSSVAANPALAFQAHLAHQGQAAVAHAPGQLVGQKGPTPRSSVIPLQGARPPQHALADPGHSQAHSPGILWNGTLTVTANNLGISCPMNIPSGKLTTGNPMPPEEVAMVPPNLSLSAFVECPMPIVKIMHQKHQVPVIVMKPTPGTPGDSVAFESIFKQLQNKAGLARWTNDQGIMLFAGNKDLFGILLTKTPLDVLVQEIKSYREQQVAQAQGQAQQAQGQVAGRPPPGLTQLPSGQPQSSAQRPMQQAVNQALPHNMLMNPAQAQLGLQQNMGRPTGSPAQMPDQQLANAAQLQAQQRLLQQQQRPMQMAQHGASMGMASSRPNLGQNRPLGAGANPQQQAQAQQIINMPIQQFQAAISREAVSISAVERLLQYPLPPQHRHVAMAVLNMKRQQQGPQ